MRKICYILIFAISLFACNEKDSTRYPLFENEKGAIVVPVKLGNNVVANMNFDTGAPFGCFELHADFCIHNPLMTWENAPDSIAVRHVAAFVHDNNPKREWRWYNRPITVNINNTDLEYERFIIFDAQPDDYRMDIDGTFNFRKDDILHVWELNFEEDYLEIHQADQFKMPKDCYIFPIVKGDAQPFLYIQFPITIMTDEGDTLTIDQPYLIDTGSQWDITLVYPAEDLDFFRKREATASIALWPGFCNRYDVSAKMFGNVEIDSFRIYTLEEKRQVPMQYVLGLNFLKRFNVFFDMKHQIVGLQPIKNFERIVDLGARRAYMSLHIDNEGRQFVKSIAPTKNNYYKDAGLREGDEIVAINGYIAKSLTPQESVDIRNSKTKLLDIIRDGVSMKLTVVVNGTDDIED